MNMEIKIAIDTQMRKSGESINEFLLRVLNQTDFCIVTNETKFLRTEGAVCGTYTVN